jgi:hypothetical protein
VSSQALTPTELLTPVDVTAPLPDDERLWSVTTIINALDRPALLYWAAEQAAEAAIAVARSLPARVDEEGREAVVKWLRDARFRRPKGLRSATELGTAVHDACELYALTGRAPEVDDEVRPYLQQFDRWCQKFQPSYEAVEMTVFSPTYGYAGTLDAIMRIGSVDGRVRVIGDYKSSRKSYDDKGNPSGPYSEVALQLGAYRGAELAAVWRPRRVEQMCRRYYLLSPEERQLAVPMPEVEGGVVIHITPEHCIAYPVRCDRPVHEAFLYVVEAARWLFEMSKHVIGEPLVPVIDRRVAS